MIDLHTHTNESDGSLSPGELVLAAKASRLDAIAITDHDTFAGYDLAVPFAEEERFDLLCGIELSTLWYRDSGRKTVHLLGYFFDAPPSAEFRTWLKGLQDARRDRNLRLAANLQSKGVEITVEEVQQLGRSMAGRPHFAKLMVMKGYVPTTQEAFDRYIGDEGEAFVERYGPEIADGIQKVLDAGGLPSLAHPVRLGVRSIEEEEAFIAHLAKSGLGAIEVYHSDHGPAQVKRYLSLANKYRLAITGGSDFHGDIKPNVKLGMMQVPTSILGSLRGRSGNGGGNSPTL